MIPLSGAVWFRWPSLRVFTHNAVTGPAEGSARRASRRRFELPGWLVFCIRDLRGTRNLVLVPEEVGCMLTLTAIGAIGGLTVFLCLAMGAVTGRAAGTAVLLMLGAASVFGISSPSKTLMCGCCCKTVRTACRSF